MIAAISGRTSGCRCGSRSAPCASAPLGQQDPADLAAADHDPWARAASASASSVQCDHRRLGLGPGLVKAEAAVGLSAQPPRWVAARQRDDLAALQLRQSPGPARAGQVTEVVDAALVEAVQPPLDRPGMAAELRGDLADLDAVPAQRDDAGALQPTGGRVTGGGQ
jgi:hypothetical protein